MLVDECLPVYDVSDSVATVVHANVAKTWDALMRVDLIEVGLLAVPWSPHLALCAHCPKSSAMCCTASASRGRRRSFDLRDITSFHWAKAGGCCSASGRATRSRLGWSASSGAR